VFEMQKMLIQNISERFSFEGWNIKAWVKGNKDALKIVIGAVVSLSLLYPETAGWFVAGGVGAIVVKAILDVIDFWSSEVRI
jgi:hypothetical protein